MADETQDTTGVTPDSAATETGTAGTESIESLRAELTRTAKALKEANREAAERRHRLDELEAAEAKRKQAEMSEADQLKAKLAEAQGETARIQQETTDRIIKAEIRAQAAALGFNDPDDAYRSEVLAAVEMTDAGEVKGLAEALGELAKAKPYLLKPPSERPTPPKADAGVGNPPQAGGPVLTPGEQAAAHEAARLGYSIDMEKIRQRKAEARVVQAQTED